MPQGCQGCFHFFLPAFLERLVAPEGNRFRIFIVKRGVEHIFCYVHQYRPRPAAPGDVESFFQHPGQILDLFHQVVVLGDGSGDAGNIRFLERIPANEVGGYLTADHHQRDGIHIGGGDAGDHIADPGTAGGETDAYFSRSPGIPVRCMDGSLFMAGEDMGEFHPVQGIIQAQHRTSRISEDDLDLFFP